MLVIYIYIYRSYLTLHSCGCLDAQLPHETMYLVDGYPSFGFLIVQLFPQNFQCLWSHARNSTQLTNPSTIFATFAFGCVEWQRRQVRGCYRARKVCCRQRGARGFLRELVRGVGLEIVFTGSYHGSFKEIELLSQRGMALACRCATPTLKHEVVSTQKIWTYAVRNPYRL